jgi:hypothetical protein
MASLANMKSTPSPSYMPSTSAFTVSLLLQAVFLTLAVLILWSVDEEQVSARNAESLVHKRYSKLEEQRARDSKMRRAVVLGAVPSRTRRVCGCGGCGSPVLGSDEAPLIDLPVPDVNDAMGAGSLSPQHLAKAASL